MKKQRIFLMVKKTKKFCLALFALFALPLLVGAGWEKIPIITEDTYKESSLSCISVGPNDEVAVSLTDGTVYIYNSDGQFLFGYKFPLGSGAAFDFTFNEDGSINLYAPRTKTLWHYDRKGNLLTKTTLKNSKEAEKYSTLNRENRIDTNGIEYKSKWGNFIKVYPDGREELFFEGYRSPTNPFWPIAVIVVTLFVIYKRREDWMQALQKLKISVRKK